MRVITDKREAERLIEAGALLRDEERFSWELVDGLLCINDPDTHTGTPLDDGFASPYWSRHVNGNLVVLREPTTRDIEAERARERTTPLHVGASTGKHTLRITVDVDVHYTGP
jgi:hypothetical protein